VDTLNPLAEELKVLDDILESEPPTDGTVELEELEDQVFILKPPTISNSTCARIFMHV
jgi:hypothetical protein